MYWPAQVDLGVVLGQCMLQRLRAPGLGGVACHLPDQQRQGCLDRALGLLRRSSELARHGADLVAVEGGKDRLHQFHGKSPARGFRPYTRDVV